MYRESLNTGHLNNVCILFNPLYMYIVYSSHGSAYITHFLYLCIYLLLLLLGITAQLELETQAFGCGNIYKSMYVTNKLLFDMNDHHVF
jgi:hypothetical protein